MDAGVLGPLFVRRGSVVCTPSAPKLRNVLAMLLVHANQIVPVSSLMRELWDDDPPSSGLTTLQTYILSLRKLFASTTFSTVREVSRKILVTRPGGYLFQADVGSLDIHRYHTSVEAGRDALSSGDDNVVVRRLSEALQQWRGPALMDVQAGRVLESKRRQLEESRLVVLEYLVDAELRLGMYREVLMELSARTVENPLHEALHAKYMQALYLSDRRVQALEVFHRLRANLVRELGLEPIESVRVLHQAILNTDTDFTEQFRVGRSFNDTERTRAWPSVRAY